MLQGAASFQQVATPTKGWAISVLASGPSHSSRNGAAPGRDLRSRGGSAASTCPACPFSMALSRSAGVASGIGEPEHVRQGGQPARSPGPRRRPCADPAAFEAFLAPARRRPQVWRLLLGRVLMAAVALLWIAGDASAGFAALAGPDRARGGHAPACCRRDTPAGTLLLSEHVLRHGPRAGARGAAPARARAGDASSVRAARAARHFGRRSRRWRALYGLSRAPVVRWARPRAEPRRRPLAAAPAAVAARRPRADRGGGDDLSRLPAAAARRAAASRASSGSRSCRRCSSERSIIDPATMGRPPGSSSARQPSSASPPPTSPAVTGTLGAAWGAALRQQRPRHPLRGHQGVDHRAGALRHARTAPTRRA